METEASAECDPAELPTGGKEQQRSEENSSPADRDKKENAVPKAFKRKISVVSASKATPAGGIDSEAGLPARKRRWGSSTVATQKKPSISITTESLKSLIPDMKPPCGPIPGQAQDVVVDLHPDDGRISEDESERTEEEDPHDKGLKIRRTVTQVIPAEGQENGKEDEREEDEEVKEPEVPVEPLEIIPAAEPEVKKVTPSETVVRRSISQQRTGMSVTIDDPVRSTQNPSPPRGKTSNIIHLCNLVRPFTLGQLKELLHRTGTIEEEGFWIDKIKSHCYAKYTAIEEAVATRNSLHGVKWPASNPKFLAVDYAEQDELDFHKGLKLDKPLEQKMEESRPDARDHERTARDQWAEREREMERRERTRSEREWDRDKVKEYEGKEGAKARSRSRSRSRDKRRKERAKSKEKRNEKKEKAPEEPPAKLLDDLFRKTKAAPCIYWLPLTVEQILQKELERADRAREREKRRKEQEEEERKQAEQRKERAREREKEAERKRDQSRERERGRERERERERERRDNKHRSRSTSNRERNRR